LRLFSPTEFPPALIEWFHEASLGSAPQVRRLRKPDNSHLPPRWRRWKSLSILSRATSSSILEQGFFSRAVLPRLPPTFYMTFRSFSSWTLSFKGVLLHIPRKPVTLYLLMDCATSTSVPPNTPPKTLSQKMQTLLLRARVFDVQTESMPSPPGFSARTELEDGV